MVATERRSYWDIVVVVGILAAVVLVTQLPRQSRQDRPGAERDAHVLAVLGSARRTVTDGGFRSGEVTAVMGNSRLDLRQVALAPGEEVTVEVLAVMAGITIRVPDGWVVDAGAVPVLGQLKDARMLDEAATASSESRPPRLVLHGAVVMGGIRITS